MDIDCRPQRNNCLPDDRHESAFWAQARPASPPSLSIPIDLLDFAVQVTKETQVPREDRSADRPGVVPTSSCCDVLSGNFFAIRLSDLLHHDRDGVNHEPHFSSWI